MSRIGMRPVAIPPGVKVTVEPTVFHVEGPKGKLSQEYRPEVQIAVKMDLQSCNVKTIQSRQEHIMASIEVFSTIW